MQGMGVVEELRGQRRRGRAGGPALHVSVSSLGGGDREGGAQAGGAGRQSCSPHGEGGEETMLFLLYPGLHTRRGKERRG